MASLRDTVKDYQEELRDGIAWVAFWKTGRSWNAEYFHLEMGDILYPEDRSRMEEIKQADPAAVVVNGYYSGYLGEDMNLDELTAGVRRHYENGYSNIGEFIEAHDDRLPPELIEEARAAALRAGLIEAEARRIVQEMKRRDTPNSPNRTHFMVELSPTFMQLASSKDTDRLFSMLPYKTLSFSKIEGRHGTYALIDKNENRGTDIRRVRPSIRAQLAADKRKAAPKKAAVKSKNHELEV